MNDDNEARISAERTEELLDLFRHKRVIVFGDYFLDRYLLGKVFGASPEMPVLRVTEEKTRYAPGAAGNVAMNLAAMGTSVAALGVIGEDDDSRVLVQLLAGHGINTSNFIVQPDRTVDTITRIVVSNIRGMDQHLIRTDKCNSIPLSKDTIGSLRKKIDTMIEDCDAVLIADYDENVNQCGVVSTELASYVCSVAQSHGILVAGGSRAKLSNLANLMDILFCNMREAQQMLSLHSENEFETGIARVVANGRIQTACVTLEEKGVICFSKQSSVKLAANRKAVVDPCGAGDSFASAFLLASISGATATEACSLGIYAAGIAVTKSGTQPINSRELLEEVKSGGSGIMKLRSIEELREELNWLRGSRKVVFTNGYFDAFHSGHIQFLKKAKELGDILVVAINSDRSTRANKGAGRPLLPESARIQILSALDFVDFITVFDELTPINVILALKPDIIAKGGNYTPAQVVGNNIVETYGGRISIIPYQSTITTQTYISQIKGASDGQRQS
jgi:D-beta-D-heptose 7-phosphate kinase/D-beta-D-heptose 1-phosphate adenosyltransferase